MTAPRRLVRLAPLPDVRVGQVWEDNDSRSKGRTFRVTSVEGDVVVVENLTRTGGGSLLPGAKRVNRIQRKRFKPTSTGYRLREDV